MTIHKCDICCELIDQVEVDIRISGRRYQFFDLCEECARPIISFLDEAHLIEHQDVITPIESSVL